MVEGLVGTLLLLLPKLCKASLAPIHLQELENMLDKTVNLYSFRDTREVFLDIVKNSAKVFEVSLPLWIQGEPKNLVHNMFKLLEQV